MDNNYDRINIEYNNKKKRSGPQSETRSRAMNKQIFSNNLKLMNFSFTKYYIMFDKINNKIILF